MATYVVGFDEETDRHYLHGLRQLLAYDPDQIQMLYATPHRWTPYFRMEVGRRVIQTDIRAAIRWYYQIGRKVWFYEIWQFLVNDHPQASGPSLEEFWGEPQDGEQYALDRYFIGDDLSYPVWPQILIKDQHLR